MPNLSQLGWCWEGQGLDPGVYPSVFGVGEGADFFGVRNVHFLFHPNTDLALGKLKRFDKVVCDISKWRFVNCGPDDQGSRCINDSTLEDVCKEAENLSRLSLAYHNVTGGYFDDMQGLMEKRGHSAEHCDAIKKALTRHNPRLILECVVYAHELANREFWTPLARYIDVVSFWVWEYRQLASLEDHLARCRDLFPGKPIVMGCYMRDYPSRAPIPMEALRHQWETMARAIEDGRIQGFDILAAVLIDGHQEQANWIRDFIRVHSGTERNSDAR